MKLIMSIMSVITLNAVQITESQMHWYGKSKWPNVTICIPVSS